MKNPTRRNKNIGTSKQGHGQNNRMVIPSTYRDMKVFWERLGEHTVVTRVINWTEYKFIIEKTKTNSYHACSIDDIVEIIKNVPFEEIDGLTMIILRQPTKKEEILSSVWGRFIYSYEYKGDFETAIILESFEYPQELIRTKKQSLEQQKEFERLKIDGHKFTETKRNFVANLTLEKVRNTQLYRTLVHEFGHYVHYKKEVLDNEKEDESIEDWEKRRDLFHKIPSQEKERFANNYALKVSTKLKKLNKIPFDRILDEKTIENEKLSLDDFVMKNKG